DLSLALADLDVRFEFRGGVNELRGRARVQSEFVFDLHLAADQERASAAGRGPERRSLATRMAFEPFSLMMCASVATSFASCCIVANLTTMGRLTPVTISTRPRSRNERLMLLGVPPNMSVKMITPRSGPMRSSARRIFSRA